MMRWRTTVVATLFTVALAGVAAAMTLDEFFQARPDIPANISKWSGRTDKVWILREWIKITTERNEDYETARRILAEIEKNSGSPPSSPPPADQPSDGFAPPPSIPPGGPAPGPSAPSESESGNLAGVHWYSGDQEMIGNNGGWNVETVCGLDDATQINVALEGARRAKAHGLTNIIRLDYRGGCPVPKDPAEFQQYGDRFIEVVKLFSDLSKHFIVGNEPNIESFINSHKYAAAFMYIYNRKHEMPAGVQLLACSAAPFSPNVNADGQFADGTYLDWLEDVSNRITQVDGFAIHANGDPTRGNPDPRQPCNINNWPFDGGFQSFREQAARIAKKWGGSKPVYITEFNSDTNGLEGPNPVDTYQPGWILKAFEAVRTYNATRGPDLPPIRALCWFVDRADGQWGPFALRNIGPAREDMRAAFHDPANR